MMLRKGLQLGLVSTLIIAATTTSAEELVRYDFTDGSPTATTTGTMTATDAAFGPFTFGSSTPSLDGLGAFVRVDATNTPTAGQDLLANAIAGGDYIGFTVDTTSATPFSLSDISYTYSASSVSGFSLSSHLLTSATGFTATDSLATTTFAANGSLLVNVDLSGNTDLQGLATPLEVRVYFSDSTFANGPSHRLDDIVIQGVPEPGSLALLGLGGALILWRRRPRSTS